jgi:hypothetical protein
MAGTDPYGLYYRGWWDDMKEGFGALKEYWGSPPTPTQWWQETSSGDTLHETLQLIGLVPGLGEPADILDGVVYTLEGDTANASVSFAAALPVVGSAATASRWGKRAANAADAADDAKKLEDLTAHRKQHILNRHRAGAGKGKSEFPSRWSGDEILHHVSDIATDPQSLRGTGKWDSPFAIGTRDGVTIRVDFFPANHPLHSGKISTAYPIVGPLNP